ncbi:hypothetical protein P2G72_09075 [Cronobacter sakazakii]|uniref:hypothetical protein n=1 Tax=Cronobacter sakazakii TaxID=28141 RepID=UPI002DBA8632|nr:hypothetical protein [Cronobacter sakazakii]MEB8629947.1 hypothetical protein [Cronobacter sakazakii]
MSTISTERLEKLSEYDCADRYEVMSIATELLALRKEREKAETVGVPDLHKVVYHFRDLNEGFPVERFKADYVIAWMLANYPPAPIVPDDSLPFDSQIAEYEQMMEAEQAQADTASQQFESLAGKAVGGSEGFECTPVADLYELLTKCGECYDYTTSAKVAAAWIKDGYSAREYVKLDRLQEALLFAAPEPCK